MTIKVASLTELIKWNEMLQCDIMISTMNDVAISGLNLISSSFFWVHNYTAEQSTWLKWHTLQGNEWRATGWVEKNIIRAPLLLSHKEPSAWDPIRNAFLPKNRIPFISPRTADLLLYSSSSVPLNDQMITGSSALSSRFPRTELLYYQTQHIPMAYQRGHRRSRRGTQRVVDGKPHSGVEYSN